MRPVPWLAMPVRRPPGFRKLSTRPSDTGSVPEKKTIGTLFVARLAARVTEVVCKDQVNLLPFETPRRRLHRLQITFAIAHVEDELFALLESQLPEPVLQPVEGGGVQASLEHDSHAIDACLLRLDRERQGEEGEYQDARESESWHRHPNPRSGQCTSSSRRTLAISREPRLLALPSLRGLPRASSAGAPCSAARLFHGPLSSC